MSDRNYLIINTEKYPIKHWTKYVPFEESAQQQLKNLASLPFIHKHVAVMPDVHHGKGSTVGTVIATHKVIIPAAVGVDIGCGMQAILTDLVANDLPDSLSELRNEIEASIPVGFNFYEEAPLISQEAWKDEFQDGYALLIDKYKILNKGRTPLHQLGTLGGGNHFIEICLDENQRVWFMLHSGSRGIGNAIGTHFTELAKKEMERFFINLPDTDLSYLPQGSVYFDDYIKALHWAQKYARINRNIMMHRLTKCVSKHLNKEIKVDEMAINCHHNYVSIENHFSKNVYITRKGAVSAKKDELGIIPGSMGTKSYIVRGKGNPESFFSCSHGAGRTMSRTRAEKEISLSTHEESLKNVECRKDKSTLDESPKAYKDIDMVMKSQEDLVEIVAILRQVLCIKG